MLEELIKESGLADFWEEVGEKRGMAQGMAQMTRIALEGRFGAPLRDDVLSALNSANETTLTDLVSHITTLSLADVRARLGLN